MSNISDHQSFLINRAFQDEKYLGYAINIYAHAKKLEIDDIKRHLDCNDDSFVKLVLCRRININELNFPQQVSQVAAYTDVEIDKLSTILKYASIMSTFTQIHRKGNSASTPFSFLAAAREKENNSQNDTLDDEK